MKLTGHYAALAVVSCGMGYAGADTAAGEGVVTSGTSLAEPWSFSVGLARVPRQDASGACRG